MGTSARMQNNNGAGYSYLGTASRKDISSSQIGQSSKLASKREQQELVKSILQTVRQEIIESDSYHKSLDVKQADLILMRMASMLDEFKEKFVDEELTDIKDEIIDEISGLSTSAIFKNFLLGQISDLFDNDAKKEDIDNLKAELTELIKNGGGSSSESSESKGQEGAVESGADQTFAGKKVESLDDEQVGDFQDSTIAQNFQTLNDNIQKQLDILNKSVSKITGVTVFAGFAGFAMKGISKLMSGVAALSSKVGSFTKNTFSKIVNISKVVAGGAIGLLVKTVGGIAKGIGKAFGAIKGLGSKIGGAFKGLGAKIGGLGSKIGGAIASPFKAIGGLFKSKKEKKAEDKKEKMRDKFMGFMMKMFDKLWNFLEPILSKLKIFMLATLVPIIMIAAKVLLIVGAIALVIAAIVLAVMFVKNVLIPKIKNIVKSAIAKVKKFWTKLKAGVKEKWSAFKEWISAFWDGLVDWFKEAWNTTKDICKSIWNGIVYIVTFKWLVDFGKWLWKKLVEFGKWVKKEFIDPVVKWIREKIVDPLANFYKDKIQPVVQPFIDSAKNLWERIKKAFSAWDTNKSIWENLKNIGGIIKQSVMEWWETSPFKKAYDTYIKPIIDSLSDLISRIKSIWANFKWDENKSFLENLKSFWDQCWGSIKEWWEKSKIKEYWDKIADWFSDLWGKIKEKWNESTIGKWVNGLAAKVSETMQKIGNAVWDVPVLPLMRPFGWLIGKPVKMSDKEKEQYKKFEGPLKEQRKIQENAQKEIEKLEKYLKNKDYKGGDGTAWTGRTKEEMERDLAAAKGRLQMSQDQQQQIERDKARELAQQQVQGAMKPINSLNGMNQDTNMQLQQSGQEISQRVEAEHAAQQAYNDNMGAIGSQTLQELKAFRDEQRAANKDPAVVPMPIPYGPQRNAAMMSRRRN